MEELDRFRREEEEQKEIMRVKREKREREQQEEIERRKREEEVVRRMHTQKKEAPTVGGARAASGSKTGANPVASTSATGSRVSKPVITNNKKAPVREHEVGIAGFVPKPSNREPKNNAGSLSINPPSS